MFRSSKAALYRIVAHGLRLAAVGLFALVIGPAAEAQDLRQYLPISDDFVVECAPDGAGESGSILVAAAEPSGVAIAEYWLNASCPEGRSLIRHYDAWGDLLRTSPLPEGRSYTTADGGFYTVQVTDTGSSVSRFSTDGEVQWTTLLPVGSSGTLEVYRIRGAEPTSGVVVDAGRNYYRISENGEVLWSISHQSLASYWPAGGARISRLSNGDFVFTVGASGPGGQGVGTARVSASGEVFWVNHYQSSGSYLALRPQITHELPDGRLLVLGSGSNNSHRLLYQILTEPDGTLVHQGSMARRTPEERFMTAHEVDAVDDGQVRITAEFTYSGLPREASNSIEELLHVPSTASFVRLPQPASEELIRGVAGREGQSNLVRMSGGTLIRTQQRGTSFCHPIDGCFGSSTLRIVTLEDPRPTASDDVPQTPLSLAAYPNPTAGHVTVEGVGDRVEVYDVLGRLVLSAPAPQTGSVRLQLGLSPGIYPVRRGGATVRLTVR